MKETRRSKREERAREREKTITSHELRSQLFHSSSRGSTILIVRLRLDHWRDRHSTSIHNDEVRSEQSSPSIEVLLLLRRYIRHNRREQNTIASPTCNFRFLVLSLGKIRSVCGRSIFFFSTVIRRKPDLKIDGGKSRLWNVHYPCFHSASMTYNCCVFLLYLFNPIDSQETSFLGQTHLVTFTYSLLNRWNNGFWTTTTTLIDG